MKITIDIPDWALERHLHFIAGEESFAFKRAGDNTLYIKSERCSRCGKCCMNLTEMSLYDTKGGGQGDCVHLQSYDGKAYTCIAKLRPISCCQSDPVMNRWEDGEKVCSIRYKQIPIEG